MRGGARNTFEERLFRQLDRALAQKQVGPRPAGMSAEEARDRWGRPGPVLTGRLATYKLLVERNTSACASMIPIAAATTLSATLAAMYWSPVATSPVSTRRKASTLKVEKVV